MRVGVFDNFNDENYLLGIDFSTARAGSVPFGIVFRILFS